MNQKFYMIKFSQYGTSRKSGYVTKREREKTAKSRAKAKSRTRHSKPRREPKGKRSRNPKRHVYYKRYRRERDIMKALEREHQLYSYKVLRYVYYVVLQRLFLVLQSFKDHKRLVRLMIVVRLLLVRLKPSRPINELHSMRICNPWGEASTKHCCETAEGRIARKSNRAMRAFDKVAPPKVLARARPIPPPIVRLKKKPPSRRKSKKPVDPRGSREQLRKREEELVNSQEYLIQRELKVYSSFFKAGSEGQLPDLSVLARVWGDELSEETRKRFFVLYPNLCQELTKLC